MLNVRLARARAGRLWTKGHDLYATTNSLPRVARYYLKYAVSKLPFLVSHLRQSRAAKALAAQSASGLQADGTPLVAVRVIGGIGDYVVAARYLRDLIAHVGPFQFDIYGNNIDAGQWIFSAVCGFRSCHSELAFDSLKPSYALALHITQFVKVDPENLDRARLKAYPELNRAMERTAKFAEKIALFIEHHPFMDGFLGQKAVYMNRNRADFLHAMSGIPYTADELELATDETALEKLGLHGRAYVTIHNGFDPDFVITAERATKCYPHFREVVQLLKDRSPDVLVVQLGASTSEPIPGVDLNLIDRTSLTEAAAIIRHARLHIDNESGLVHVARCFGVRSCVVFGPTSADYFGYGANINMRPNFCGGCWWINSTWMDQCPRGFEVPPCLSSQAPEEIAGAIVPHLTHAAVPPGPVPAAASDQQDRAADRVAH